MGENSLSGYGPLGLVKRPVRTRMLGVVGAGGEKPPATRLCARARYVFLRVSRAPWVTELGKSLIQPDGGARAKRVVCRRQKRPEDASNGVAVVQLDTGDGVWGGGRLYKQGTANAWGDVQEPS